MENNLLHIVKVSHMEIAFSHVVNYIFDMSHHVNWTFSQRFDCFHRWMEMSSLETLANINYIHAFTHVD